MSNYSSFCGSALCLQLGIDWWYRALVVALRPDESALKTLSQLRIAGWILLLSTVLGLARGDQFCLGSVSPLKTGNKYRNM